MPVGIKLPGQSPGITGSKAFKGVMGYATGGPVGAAAALAGGDTAMGRALQVAQAAQGVQKQAASAIPEPQDFEYQGIAGGITGAAKEGAPSLMGATERRFHLVQGLDALQDPSVPEEYRLKYGPLFQKALGGR